MSDQHPDLTPPNESAAASSSLTKRWRILLIGSLALNLVFAGLAAGAMWNMKRHHGSGGSGRGTAELAIHGFLQSLPKERAKELRRVIKAEDRPDMGPLVAAIKQARRNAAGALAAELFDKAKLSAAFSAIDVAEAAAKAAVRSTMITAADNMTAAERQTLAERWKLRRPHMFEDRPDHHERRQRPTGEPPQ